jgi:hypothetical protein
MRGIQPPYETILLARCPVACNRCTIVYHKKKGRSMEYCMCRCHSHATPSSTQREDYEEPQIGIGIIE